MSATAKATTFEPMSSCASHSPSGRSPARSLPRSAGRSANRPGLQQPGQKAEPSQQRMPLLPRPQPNIRAGMAIDLPHDVIGAPGERQARLGEAEDGEPLPFDPP